MSTYIQIPNREIRQLKIKEITAYTHIRSQIKDNTCKASITEEELASLCGCSERTIRNYVHKMKLVGLFVNVSKRLGEGEHKYNVYEFETLASGFSMINPDLLQDSNYSCEEKGLLILLKTHCFAGTNHLEFRSYEQMANLLGIDDEKLKQLVKGLIVKDALQFSNGYLIITDPHIIYVLDDNIDNNIYKLISDYCVSKGSLPPTKNKTQNRNWKLIVGMFANQEQFIKLLEQRFPNPPATPTLAYFAQGLTGTRYHKTEKEKDLTIIL